MFLIQISDTKYFFVMNKTNCYCTLNCHVFPSTVKCLFLSPSEVQFFLFLLALFCIFPHYLITFQFMTCREGGKSFSAFNCLVNEPPWDVEFHYHFNVCSLWSVVLQYFVLSMYALHWYFFQIIIFPIHLKCTWIIVNPDVSSIKQLPSPFLFCIVRVGSGSGKLLTMNSQTHWTSLTPLDL